MNIELILWIVAFFIVWEAIYIWYLKYRPTLWGDKRSWVDQKIISLLWTLGFFWVQVLVLTIDQEWFNPVYDRLIWEGLILAGLFLFFKLNKSIYEKINKRAKKK